MSVLASIEPLPWDSEFFSFPIARLSIENVQASQPLTLDALNQYPFIQAKVECSNYALLHKLQQFGFQLVSSEVDFEITSLNTLSRHVEKIELATPMDCAQLTTLAGQAFQLSRFRAPWFSEQDNRRLYQAWVEKAINGTYDDCCLVIKDQSNNIKGFVTIKELANSEARIGLLAVNPEFKRQGIGEQLVNGAIAWCLSKTINCLRIATQMENIAASRLYIKSGATIASSAYWLYRSNKQS